MFASLRHSRRRTLCPSAYGRNPGSCPRAVRRNAGSRDVINNPGESGRSGLRPRKAARDRRCTFHSRSTWRARPGRRPIASGCRGRFAAFTSGCEDADRALSSNRDLLIKRRLLPAGLRDVPLPCRECLRTSPPNLISLSAKPNFKGRLQINEHWKRNEAWARTRRSSCRTRS
jgi:hypothetical protein